MSFIVMVGNGVPLLKIYVQPKSSQVGFKGVHDNMLKLCISAAPVDGKANRAVVAYLAKFFQVSRKEVVIVSGEMSRRKKVIIGDLEEDQLRKKLVKGGVTI